MSTITSISEFAAVTAYSVSSPSAPWAFYAPSTTARIEAALELAALQPGERFVDLGCGDGRVLLAAAQLGAHVRGIEIDPDLARAATRTLESAGFSADIEVADFFDASLAADVVYAYLTPALLARLRHRFAELSRSTRIVTPVYRIAGWTPVRSEADCSVYGLPASPEPPPEAYGFAHRAILLVVPPDRRCLLPLTLAACAGEVAIELEVNPPRAASFALGFEHLDKPARVPLDLIFNPGAAGEVVLAVVRHGNQEFDAAVVSAASGIGRWAFGFHEGFAFQRSLAERIRLAREFALVRS